MYGIVKSFVKYKNMHSDLINSKIGVKQGDPASSILCLFFLNDILNNINRNIPGIVNIDDIQVFLLLFADDAVVFTHDPNSLQSILNDIEHYCNMWNLKLNVSKTKVMIFENGRHTSYDFFLYNTRIEIVESFKYLGVYLFKNGNWNRTQKYIAQHASYSLHNLFIVCNQLELPVSQMISLFDSIVLPTLNYAAEVWGHHAGPNIEIIHTKFCRRLLCVKQSTNVDVLYGELGRTPMSIHRKLILIKYWLKLLKLNERTILYKIFIMLKTDADNGVTYSGKNWAYTVKTILEQTGLFYMWEISLLYI